MPQGLDLANMLFAVVVVAVDGPGGWFRRCCGHGLMRSESLDGIVKYTAAEQNLHQRTS